MVVSTALALAVGACLLGAVAVVLVAPLLYGDVAPGLASRCCWCSAGRPRPRSCCSPWRSCCTSGRSSTSRWGWVTRGTLMIMAGWLVMSAGFGLYLRYVADYNSIFGGLASVVVLIAYLYAARRGVPGRRAGRRAHPRLSASVRASGVVDVGEQLAVDEERRGRARRPPRAADSASRATRGGVLVRRELRGHAVAVEPEPARVRGEVAVGRARPRAAYSASCILPERALGGRGLGRLGGVLGVRMDAGRAAGGGRRSAARRPAASRTRARIDCEAAQYGHSKSPYITSSYGRVGVALRRGRQGRSEGRSGIRRS